MASLVDAPIIPFLQVKFRPTVIFIHGEHKTRCFVALDLLDPFQRGPGGGTSGSDRVYFNPAKYKVGLFYKWVLSLLTGCIQV